jgi:hypothetical protein
MLARALKYSAQPALREARANSAEQAPIAARVVIDS